ncbi:hypothetical protein JCM1840_001608 [Sporobolomyces johnsonii]
MLSLDLRTLDIHHILLNYPAPGSHDVLVLAILYGLVALATLVALVSFLCDLAHEAANWIRTSYKCHQCGGVQRPTPHQHLSVADNLNDPLDGDTDDEFTYEDGSVADDEFASLDLLGEPTSFERPPFASEDPLWQLYELFFFLQLLCAFEPVIVKNTTSIKTNSALVPSPEYITLAASGDTSQFILTLSSHPTPPYPRSRSSQCEAIEACNPSSSFPSAPPAPAGAVPSAALNSTHYIAISVEDSPPSLTVSTSSLDLEPPSPTSTAATSFSSFDSDDEELKLTGSVLEFKEILDVPQLSPTPADSPSSTAVVHLAALESIHLDNFPRRLPTYSPDDSLSDVSPRFLRRRLLDRYLWDNIAAADAAKEELEMAAVEQMEVPTSAVGKSWTDCTPEDDEEFFATLPVWEEDGVLKRADTVASAFTKPWSDYTPEDDEEYFATLPVWEEDEVP